SSVPCFQLRGGLPGLARSRLYSVKRQLSCRVEFSQGLCSGTSRQAPESNRSGRECASRGTPAIIGRNPDAHVGGPERLRGGIAGEGGPRISTGKHEGIQ